jgi:4-diphosphocytidyl-2-C-methyl-D-erythritol kinase
MKCLSIDAPAKVNLDLRVGRPRADGFHPVYSWMRAIRLFDTLSMTNSPGEGVKLECDPHSLPADASNLVIRAAHALLNFIAHANPAPLGARVSLTKRIPIGAGLGGGSSDAAAALEGLSQLWELALNPGQLNDIARGLGSDVPFFLAGGSGVCEGRGERVRKTGVPAIRFCLLLFPPFPQATKDVYRQFDTLNLGGSFHDQPLPDYAQWIDLSAAQLLPLLKNDLESAAFSLSADLRLLHDRAESALNRTVRMSGSGSTLFSLYDSPQEASAGAEMAARQLNITSLAVEFA